MALVPGVQILRATFDDGKGIDPKSVNPGSIIIKREGLGYRSQQPWGLTTYLYHRSTKNGGLMAPGDL